MESPFHQIIREVAVWHLLVSAIVVLAFARRRGAVRRVRRSYFDLAFVEVAIMRVVQVAIVDIVDMAFVLNFGVATVYVVLACVVGGRVTTHGNPSGDG
jgi:hypothetical protein